MSVFADFKYYGISNLKILYLILFSHGTSAVFWYRLARWFYQHKLNFLCPALYRMNLMINGCDISYKADIGIGFKMYHSIGVVIGTIKAGEGFCVYQNVTIGKNLKVAEDGQTDPIIGNKVTFYSGSVVAGPITIGDDVSVGANAVLLKDVPNGGKVIAAKSTII